MSLGRPKITNTTVAGTPAAPPAMQGADALKLGTDAGGDQARRATLGRLRLRVAKASAAPAATA